MHRDLERIKRDVLTMGGLVEDSLASARLALASRDIGSVESIERVEVEIDRLQLEIDDEVLKLLALHQPVAGDLRFVMAAMKIVNDLERIGDLTCNIADRLREVLGTAALTAPLNLREMMQCAGTMVSRALNSFVHLDEAEARAVLRLDDQVDDFNRSHFALLIERMRRDPQCVELAVGMLSISRSVERIADLATNIAEDVVFICTGEDVRHSKVHEQS